MFVIAIVAVIIGAAAFVIDNGNNYPVIDDSDTELEFVGNMSTNVVSLYLSQKGSSERTLLDNGGTFKVPTKDAIIIVVANNPSGDITIDKDSVMVPKQDTFSETTYKCVVMFGPTSSEDPVKIDSTSAYYSFTPKSGETVNLGLFVTNYY